MNIVFFGKLNYAEGNQQSSNDRKNQMTKVRLRKVLLLFIVTLSIYGYYWLARSRREIMEQYKVKIPHWIWLVAPPVVAVLTLFPLAFIAMGATGKLSGTYLIVLGVLLLEILVVYGIGIWWMWKYGRYAERLTQGRVSLGWIITYWIVFPLAVILMLQYSYNRTPKVKDLNAKPKYKPTKKFSILAYLGLAAVLVTSVGSYYMFPEDTDWQADQAESLLIDGKYNKQLDLLKKYNACNDKLNKDYPAETIAPEEEESYAVAFDTCENIRIEQNAAVDDYNKALENW